MAEQVDLTKAVKSVVTPVYWVKCVMYGLGIGCLVLVGFAVKKAYFTKPSPTQHITMQEGSQLTIRNEAAKRRLIMFAEPFVAVDTKDKGSIGIRAGCRWEF